MTATIYFFSERGYAPMKDAKLKNLTSGSHGWQPEGQAWVFGVVHVKEGVHPLDVVDHMASLGITVLPSVWDSATPIDQKVYAALSPWVSAADNTRAIAEKMGQMHPHIRPHFY